MLLIIVDNYIFIRNYFIMLIVTDGINNDTDNTIDEIV